MKQHWDLLVFSLVHMTEESGRNWSFLFSTRFSVWNASTFLGDLMISTGVRKPPADKSNSLIPDIRPEYSEIPHLGFMVQALAIDSRSRYCTEFVDYLSRIRYLFSGDSEGSILMWRPDSFDWYQLLRRFKKGLTVHLFPDRYFFRWLAWSKYFKFVSLPWSG